MAEPYRIATGVEVFGRPSGALGIMRFLTQGSVRFRGLLPALPSLLPPGADARGCREPMSLSFSWRRL